MTTTNPNELESGEAPAKPVPVPDDGSAAFFEAAARGELVVLRCQDCGTFMSPTGGIGTPRRPCCINCFSRKLEWAPTSGKAVLHSYVLMHQVYHPGFADEVPYNIAIVELEEGVRLTTNIVDCPNDELTSGMPLQVTFEDVTDEVALPKFRRAS
jgi:uncharacterized OB-fold protein